MTLPQRPEADRPAGTGPGIDVANFIDGQWVTPRAPSVVREITDPASGAHLGTVAYSGRSEVDDAVAAAKKAFPGWRATPVAERVRVLFRLKILMDEHRDEFAKLLTREHGKNIAETRGEIQRGIENIEHACGMPSLMMGETLEDVASGIDCEAIRQPLGVFAGITPYNFPVMIPLWFWPYAVAAGNTFVLKPSEQDPLTHQKVVELAIRAGLPPGVLNVVHGGREVVSSILEHPDIVGVSFVGSSHVARVIYAECGRTGKRVQALGGAKNHMLVLPDADLELTAKAVTSSIFGSAGQRCLAGSVMVGVGDVYERIREQVLDETLSLKVGHGLEEGVDMGPVISAAHRDRVEEYIYAGEREGARVAVDGRGFRVEGYPAGHWVGPTVLEGVDPGMSVGRDEIFGPVLGMTRVASVEDALALMERIDFGNATSIFTTSGRAARQFRYHAGISMMGVNIGVAAPMAFFPFGGSKASFYGDLKAQGSDAVRFFTDRRVVISRW